MRARSASPDFSGAQARRRKAPKVRGKRQWKHRPFRAVSKIAVRWKSRRTAWQRLAERPAAALRITMPSMERARRNSAPSGRLGRGAIQRRDSRNVRQERTFRRAAVHAPDVSVLRAAVSGLQTCAQDLRSHLLDGRSEAGQCGASRIAVRRQGARRLPGGCLLFWKDAWLQRVKEYDPDVSAGARRASRIRASRRAAPSRTSSGQPRVADVANGETDTRYVCQTTQLPEFTKPLPWWSPAQYVEDYRSRNTTLPKMARGLFYSFSSATRRGLHPPGTSTTPCKR